jgi:hypothetical protein
MFFSEQLVGQLARERIEREIATAALLRQRPQPSQTFRQAVGRRVIRFGARLAAEPSLESARSR